METKTLVVLASLTILTISVVLAVLGVSQAIVSALIGAVSSAASILWKWLGERQSQEPTASLVVNEAVTLGGKRRHDFDIPLEEGQMVQVSCKATEGRYSVGFLSETDYLLQKRSGDYDREWYYEQRMKVTKTFTIKRSGRWYLVLWNEESYPLQISVKVASIM